MKFGEWLKKTTARWFDLFLKWLGIIILLTFSEIVVGQAINVYSEVHDNSWAAVWVLIYIVVGSGLLALLSFGWPQVQKLIDVMFGDTTEAAEE